MSTKRITLIALFSAILCVLGPLSIPIGPISFSLTPFGVCLAAYVLGMRDGVISCLIYLLIGAIGLPVFSGFQGGLIKLLGPTGGYLIGFIFLSLCTGVVAQYAQNNISLEFLGMIIGLFLCYLLGTLWLSHQMHLGFFKALSVGVIPFIIPDLIKLILARSIGIKIKKINGGTTV